MTTFSLRSLLLAAIFLSNCISWTASRHHYTHNVSGHRSRHRRNGAGLFLSASYVLPGGEGDGWGEWGEVSSCSRTCGGGVASQKRICLKIGPDGVPQCTGGDTKFFTCETQDCPSDARDFREQQCSEYDDKQFNGLNYRWVPYTQGPNPCELNCMPHGERFYYRQAPKVVDGTRCNDESFDVCVNGTCQPVGCDMMLGSSAREDKCRVCRGNGDNCRTTNGVIDTTDLRKGYNDIFLIPDGATNIVIAERAPSRNYLALRAKSNDTYYLNGGYQIDFPRSLTIAGALWYYERSQQGFAAPDKLRCLGPTNEPLILSLLLQDENVGIEYEYSLHSNRTPPTDKQYNWAHGEYSECSAACGGGIQTREVTCRSREELELVEEALCDPDLKPPTNQTCNTAPCAAQWSPGPWGECSKRCGEGGIRSREVHCTQVISNGLSSIVGEKSCIEVFGSKPELHQTCNENATCPIWFTGPWRPCDKLCGVGKQTRQVVCYQKNGSRKEILADEECETEKPAAKQSCTLQPCEGVDWVLSEWHGCDSCLSTVRTRTAVCATKTSDVVADSFCAYHATPTLQEACDKTKLPPCDVQWYATQWSKCSVECGKGIQSRKVFCGLFDGASVLKVDDSRCNKLPKYNETKECEVPEDKCPAQWFAGPWGACTNKCGGGQQYRRVMCLRGGAPAKNCTEDPMLSREQDCNTQSCDTVPVAESTSPPDDYDDCEEGEEEEEFPEAGLESDEKSTIYDSMFSDSTDEPGSGTPTAEHESTFDTTDTAFSVDELLPIKKTSDSGLDESSGSGSGEGSGEDEVSGSGDISTTEFTDSTPTETDTGSTDADKTTVSGETDSSDGTSPSSDVTTSIKDYETEETESTDTGATTASGETTETKITASEVSSLSSGAESTSETSTVSGSESTDLSSSSVSEGSTESSSTSETESTLSTESSATEEITGDTTTKTDETSESVTTGTDETVTTETSESSETTDTSDIESTTVVDTSSTNSESSTTETSESTTAESSVTTETDITTEISSTDVTKTTDTSTTDSAISSSTESTETTESATTDSTETTEPDSKSTTEAETATTESTETTESGTTESAGTIESSTTESAETSESSTTESTETSESSTTESAETSESSTTVSAETTDESSTVSTETTGSTESSLSPETTEISSSTEPETTEPTGTTESTGTSESESTISTDTTESTTTEFGSTESTEVSGSTETTEEVSTISSEGTESTEFSTTESSSGTTRWDLSSTVEVYTSTTTKKRMCRPRSCTRSEFGCCPDKKTPALGPFDEGCPKPETCKESLYGCCPDGLSPAQGPVEEGCPLEPCAETFFGCCSSDNQTAAEGNDQEGCPPPPPACFSSKYGCCEDATEAKGPAKEGCPETATTTVELDTVTEESSSSTNEDIESTTSISTESEQDCRDTEFGCCFDGISAAAGPDLQGCPCSASEFGCCPDGVATAEGPDSQGCVKSCNTSTFGCCPDGKTPAHGPGEEGCCLLYPYGCCPDNYKPADGPHLEGCGCQSSRYGCCPDNVTVASGPDNKGCGCQYSKHGCCPDRHTDASGPEFDGCMCHTYQFGCCPDGVTVAVGPNGQGCYCQYSQFGCCGDEQTHAKGPNKQGCDCSTSKHGCCLDGVTEATGPKFEGCTEKPLDKQAACGLKFERGPCRNYSVGWFYDTEYGGCSRFWYGGCEGNGNRFSSKEECEDTCVSPPAREVCRLPQIKGACLGYHQRWYYDTEREMCSNFIYGGCLGNENNFETREKCQDRCEPERAADQCSLTIERGSCAGHYLRWGYNKNSKTCEQFVWGGCEGNSNRFSSEAACMLRCNPPGEPQQPELCTLPASTGECYDYREKWYFDTKAQRCNLFYYGGCGGNENRFDSETECINRCIPPTTTPAPTAPTAVTQATPGSEFCFMEIDAGPCNQVESKWGYDYKRGKCVSFQYGGCGGNQNNFPSEEHCTYYCKPAQDICQLPMLAGPCEDSLMRWFYDASSDSCSQFTYGGCDGNDNQFETREQCENRCKTGTPVSTTTVKASTMIDDNLPPECAISSELEQCSPAAAGEVWFYDRDSSACKAHGNSDSGAECRTTGVFYSQEACERACGVFRGIDVCQYDVEPGPCSDFRPKYFYNRNASRCDEFAYGGCFGGANRFSSAQECQQICMTAIDPCTLPAEPGNCVGHNVMWYFNQDSDECQQFVFGGCGGNDNKFDSREACEGQCRRQRPPVTTTTLAPATQTTPQYQPEPEEECRTPQSLTPCGTNETVFYFDEASSTCRAADIGGCSSSVNLYRSEEECERRCGAFRGVDVCRVGLDPGPCRGAFPKFYFEVASGRCLEFTYGGCQGGANRFSTVEECEEICANAGPEPSDPCAAYSEECTALESTCVNGLKISLTPESCTRCVCEEPNCDAQRRECAELRCRYGVETTATPDGCEKCKCLEDPCLRRPCAPTERCVVVSARDPVTQEVTHQAQCESNEIEECEAYVAECSRLQCPYGVQRTRVGRCERCSCVREETDCAPLQLECERLKCRYGLNRTMFDDGCERCKCLPPPCNTKTCPDGQRCVAAPFRDPITQESRYTANCLIVNKPGVCPALDEPISRSTESSCREECRDDADCRGVLKCCARGCTRLCLAPEPPTTPQPSTTHTPDVPRAPEANADPSLSQPQVDAQEGGKATLRCYFHGNPPPKITWRFGEVTIDGSAGRYRLLSDGALEIISLYRNDSGVYICVAQNELGSAQQQVTLTVAVPVQTSLPATATVAVGAQLSLPCEVDGYPEPQVSWTKDGVPVAYSDRIWTTGPRLTIERAEVSDGGVYSCHAANEYSAHSSAVRVTVQEVSIPATCIDNPTFANCALIVQSKFCVHKYYSKFCCRSCVEAGQLDPRDVLMQADQSLYRK